MIDNLQNQLHEVAANAQEMEPANSEEKLYQATIGLIYTLIEDGQLVRLHQALHLNFPQYFDNKHN